MSKETETLTMTPKLRWLQKMIIIKAFTIGNNVEDVARNIDVLQQLHISDTGLERWVDVPTVIEGNTSNKP